MTIRKIALDFHLFLLVVLAAACTPGNSQPFANPPASAVVTIAPPLPEPTGVAPAAEAVTQVAPFALQWTGAPDPTNLPGECGVLKLAPEAGQAVVATCGGQEKEVPFRNNQLWLEMQQNLGAFEYRSEQETLIFRGRGPNSGPAWQQAVLRWVHGRYMELSTGRAGAAGTTAVSWFLGADPQQAGVCKHLTVLNFGYATTELVPCAGGQATQVQAGWLATPELEAFDAWLRQGSTLYEDNNYFAGNGIRAFTPVEAQAIAAWAERVYNQIRSQRP